MVSGIEHFLFSGFGGFTGISAALAVALKQQFPEQPLIEGVPQLNTIRYQHLPFIMFISCLVLFIIIPSSVTCFLVVQCSTGCLLSWHYLRRYYQHPDTGAIGDSDDEFAFYTLLPRIFRPSPVHLVVHSDSEISAQEPERDPAAERRRAMAVKMINEKLAERAQSQTESV